MASRGRKLQTRETFVYVAKNTRSSSNNKVKVGITHDIKERMSNLGSVSEFAKKFSNRRQAREAERFLLKKFKERKVPRGRAPAGSREYLYVEAEEVIRALKRFATGGGSVRSRPQQKSRTEKRDHEGGYVRSQKPVIKNRKYAGVTHILKPLWLHSKDSKNKTACDLDITPGMRVIRSKSGLERMYEGRSGNICSGCFSPFG